MNMEHTLESVTKLSPQKNDVLVFRIRGQPLQEVMRRATAEFREHGIEAVLCFVEDDSDIYILDEARMAECGWVRS